MVVPAQEPPAVAPRPALEFELDARPFTGVATPPRGEAFTLLANDADLDGDPDLLVNWHVFAPPALLWNDGGRFARGQEPWSLPEHSAAPLLDGEKRALLEAVRRREEAGVYLWHSDRGSVWFVVQKGPFPRTEAPSTLVVACNRPIAQVQGARAESYELLEGRTLRIPLVAEGVERAFFATQDIGLQVRVHVEGDPVPLFVGPLFVRSEGPLELWGRDPHGMAWLDVTGSRQPDVAVVRGALRGLLQPPMEGKFDDFYVAQGEPRPTFARRELPRSHGRGRVAQWVDVEGDGRLELYVGNKSSPNVLLAFDPAFARAEDRAPALGLDLPGADALAWVDLDDDGYDDLLTLDASGGLGLLRSDGGRRFERLDARERGLTLTPGAAGDLDSESGLGTGTKAADAPVIDQHDLALFDADNDGDLDLLVTGWDSAGSCVFYRAEAGAFAEASAAVGLGGIQGMGQVVVADFDADAWLDLLCLGSDPRLFHNLRGRFEEVVLPAAWRATGAVVGSACDADGDGRIDVALASGTLVLARNRSVPRGSWVWLTLAGPHAAPVGAFVRAIHADGSVQTRRAGSHPAGHLAQVLGVLALATPPENPIRRIEVRFPGGATVRHAVSGPGAIRLAPPE